MSYRETTEIKINEHGDDRTPAERIFLDLVEAALDAAQERGVDRGLDMSGAGYYMTGVPGDDEYDILRKLKESGVQLKDVGETDD